MIKKIRKIMIKIRKILINKRIEYLIVLIRREVLKKEALDEEALDERLIRKLRFELEQLKRKNKE